jgi:ATP-binding cassette subfamily B protein
MSQPQKTQTPLAPKFDKVLLLRIFRLANPHKQKFYIALLLTLIAAFLAPYRPYLIQYTIDHPIAEKDISGIVSMSIAIAALLLLQTALQWYNTMLSNTIAQDVVMALRNKIFNYLTSLKLRFYDKTPIGTLVTRTISDIETLADVFAEGLINISGDVLQIIFILGIMFYTDWELSLVSLSVLPFLLYAGYLFKEKVRVSFEDVRTQVARLNTFVQEHIQGMNIVQLFNREEKEFERFKAINNQHRISNIKSIFYYSVFFPVVEIIAAVSTGLIVWYASLQIIDHQATPGVMIAFIMYINMFFRPRRQVADRFNNLQMGMVASRRVFDLLDNVDNTEPEGIQTDVSFKDQISFSNVWFAYKDEDYVIRGISFDVEPGKTLAIVGQTGSGKSTTINLLSRFYEISKGEIKIGGNDIKHINLHTLRSQIGIVLQDVFLFSGTIYDNIVLFRPDITPQQVEETAKLLGVHDFIMRLPNGYKQEVQERGLTLSVGQRQLISFVRAMVTNPPLLILDEATSSVDHETEEIIQRAITKMMANRTCIIIAHRLSTIQHAHEILVMNKGEIAETGSHETLIAYGGIYARMHAIQRADSSTVYE